jgi:hypothetical protein
MADGWYLKLIVFFLAPTLESLHLNEQSFVQWKMMDIPKSFIWIIISVNRPFEYGDGGMFELLRWMQNLHRSTWDRKISYPDRPFEDEQFLMRQLLRKSLSMNMEDGWQLKFKFYFWREFMNRCT